ncbi:universal stress protein [Jeotgalibacillus salarius]|nr:universal stress protein [Jeotgalibacillus salarius]
MTKILLATDGSEHSKRALEKAIKLAKKSEQTTVDMIYAVDGSKSKSDVLQYGDTDTANYQRLKKLKALGEPLREAGVEANYHIVHGEPAKAIIAFANERDYDMVVIGSRGRSEVQKFLLGSVSHKLVKYVHAPVVVVK